MYRLGKASSPCSVCLQGVDAADGGPAAGGPRLTCGLCGASIIVPASESLGCRSCGEPITASADGVKLCDGTVVHALCRTPSLRIPTTHPV